MAHFRRQIRDELRSRLAALAGIVLPVRDSRDIPPGHHQIPFAFLTFDGEQLEDKVVAPDAVGTIERRVLTANVGVCCSGPNELDDLAEQIEKLMAPAILPGLLHAMEQVDFDDPSRGERDFFSLSLRLVIRYSLDQRSPDRLAE